MIEARPIIALSAALFLALALGFGAGTTLYKPTGFTTTESFVSTSISTVLSTSFSVSLVTLAQQVSTLSQTATVTNTFTPPPSTVTATQTQTATVTATSTTTQTQTTVIIYSQTATTSATTNGQISSTAALRGSPIYPGKNATVDVTVNNGVGQILNMTFTPSVQTASQADHMTFYPASFSRIVLTGMSTFNFSAKVNGYSSPAPSVDYQVQVTESYVLNGVAGAISASVDIPISNPLSILGYSISGSISGSCPTRPNPGSIGDYYCTIIGNPNASGTISWQGQVVGGGQGCITWQVVSPVIQVFVNNASAYNPCDSNGQPGFVIGPGTFGVSFSLGIPSSGANQNNSVEFIWG